MKSRRAPSIQLLSLAVGAALAVLLPRSAWVREIYTGRVYGSVQTILTNTSNHVQFPLFDVTVGVAALAVFIIWVIDVRMARRRRTWRPIASGLLSTAVVATTIYVWFLIAWGLNYARPPLETTLPFDRARITPAAVRALAERAVQESNRGYEAAHASGFPPIDAVPPALEASLLAVTRELGHPVPRVLTHPKSSMFSPYFRASGVSGMLAPFFLETLLNPDLTGPERPYVLAHEWAHLAGFAPEADAGFVGILAALRADPGSQYSAWLSLVSESVSQLQPVTRGLVLKQLAEGPRADQAAIDQRLRALVPQVERVAWATYDRALKSQGVVEGVESYSRVVQLLLGTDALRISS